MDDRTIRQLFPEISKIKDKMLAEKVVATWVCVLELAKIENNLTEFPFFDQAPGEPLIGHIRKVIRFALALAQSLSEDENS